MKSIWSSARTPLLQDSVEFKRLGLVVIDEQHKFGVRQRGRPAARRAIAPLLGDDRHADPAHAEHDAVRRSRCLHLRDMPPGRQPISTYLVEPDQQARWWKFVRDKLS